MEPESNSTQLQETLSRNSWVVFVSSYRAGCDFYENANANIIHRKHNSQEPTADEGQQVLPIGALVLNRLAGAAEDDRANKSRSACRKPQRSAKAVNLLHS